MKLLRSYCFERNRQTANPYSTALRHNQRDDTSDVFNKFTLTVRIRDVSNQSSNHHSQVILKYFCITNNAQVPTCSITMPHCISQHAKLSLFAQHEPRYNSISWRVAIQILRIKTHSHRHVLLLQQRGTGGTRGTVGLISFLRTVISDVFLGIVKHPAAKLLRSTETVALWDAMWQWLTNSATFVWQDPAFS